MPKDVLALEDFFKENGVCKEDYLKMHEINQSITDQKKNILKFSECAGINSELAGHICDGYGILKKDLEDKLSKKVSPINKMWFNHIINRSRTCKPPLRSWNYVFTCKEKIKKLCILDENKDFRPHVTATSESVFVHSEQIGLAHMHDQNNFQNFLQKIIKTRQLKKNSVKYLVMYEYTDNSSCKRCARSIWYDFNNTLKKIIHTSINSSVNIRFILAATKPYSDTAFRTNDPDSPIDGPNDYQMSDDVVINFSLDDIKPILRT